jgi:hypothetical protein
MAGLGRKVWAADEILAAEDLQDYIQDQVVFVYDNSSARASGILAPTEGMVSYLKDTNLLYVHDGTNWVEALPATLPVANGGTGANTAAGARTNLSVPSLSAFNLLDATVEDLEGEVNSLQSAITAIPAGNITSGTLTRPVSTSGNGAFGSINVSGAAAAITSTGNAFFNNGVTSPHIYNNAVSGLAVFVASNGILGKGASTRKVKDNIVDADIDIDSVLNIPIRNFVYKPDMVESDGSVQVGVVAEELVELGLKQFVFFENGEPSGVHYDKLALLALRGLQVESERLNELEARVEKLEK